MPSPAASPTPPTESDADAPAVRTDSLVVRFGALEAVDGLDLVVRRGRTTALLGPNGAGKTTTLDVLEGLRRPTSGTVRVLGRDPWRAPATHRAAVGVQLQSAGIPSGMRALEAVRSAADLYTHPRSIDELSDRLRLHEIGGRPFRRLSGGEKQRIALAAALVGRPSLLILDEPTAGMDPAVRREVWRLLREERDAGVAVLVTTHLIDEAEQVADDVVVMASGRVVAAGAPADLVGPGYEVSFTAEPGLACDAAPAGSARRLAEIAPGRYVLSSPDEAGAMPAVLAWADATGATVTGLRAGPRRLEDAVLELVDWDAP